MVLGHQASSLFHSSCFRCRVLRHSKKTLPLRNCDCDCNCRDKPTACFVRVWPPEIHEMVFFFGDIAGASWSLCIKNSVEASGKREVQTARDPFWSRMGGSGRATKQRRHLSVSVRWTTNGPRTPPPPSKPQAAGECHEVRHHVPQFSVLIGSSDVRLGGADRKKKAAFLPFTICYWGLGACRPPSLPSPSQSGG